MAATKFTEPYINALKASAQRYERFDSIVPGLALRVSTTGTKTWMVFKSINGKTVKENIGSYPQVCLQEARMACSSRISQLVKGQVATPSKKTVEDVLNIWASERHLSDTTRKNVELVRRCLHAWGWANRDRYRSIH